MEKAMEEARRAYDDFVAAMTAMLEAKAAAGGKRTAATDEAVQEFGDRYRSFLCALDAPEAMVDAARQRFTAELGGGFVDESTAGRMPQALERTARAIDLFAADGRLLQQQRSPSGGACDVAASPPVNDPDGKSSDTTT